MPLLQPITCENCGNPLPMKKTSTRGRKQHFCNSTCRGQYHTNLKLLPMAISAYGRLINEYPLAQHFLDCLPNKTLIHIAEDLGYHYCEGRWE